MPREAAKGSKKNEQQLLAASRRVAVGQMSDTEWTAALAATFPEDDRRQLNLAAALAADAAHKARQASRRDGAENSTPHSLQRDTQKSPRAAMHAKPITRCCWMLLLPHNTRPMQHPDPPPPPPPPPPPGHNRRQRTQTIAGKKGMTGPNMGGKREGAGRPRKRWVFSPAELVAVGVYDARGNMQRIDYCTAPTRDRRRAICGSCGTTADGTNWAICQNKHSPPQGGFFM